MSDAREHAIRIGIGIERKLRDIVFDLEVLEQEMHELLDCMEKLEAKE